MMGIRGLRETWRAASQFHENEKLVAWLQSRWAVVWFSPRRRRIVLCIGAVAIGIKRLLHRNAEWRDYLAAPAWLAPGLALPILFGLVYLIYLAAVHFRSLPETIRRRPQISLHLLLWATLAVVWLTPDNGGTWRTVLVLLAFSLLFLIWRCGYMLMSGQRGKAKGTAFRDHLFYLWPVWGGPDAPAGKGWDYLSQCEAQSTEAYARSCLAGIKLLILALIWKLSLIFLPALVYGDPKSPLTHLLGGYSLGIPRIGGIADGDASVSLLTTWISLYLEMVWDTLHLAARGHVWIGTLRLLGFNAFRNTYKPLFAESIIDFWSRYYYYFKELLVEFFFYPTYLRYFRTRPKLRMLAAVFAAAFVGNIYYHLLGMDDALVAAQFAEIRERLSTRLAYCFFLALGIFFSMLRQQKQRGRVKPGNAGTQTLRRLRSIAGVWTFFSLLHCLRLRTGLTILERAKFFMSLFGL
jgi:hypothetical protein